MSDSVSTANPCDPVQQSKRHAQLEELYHRDGRDRKDHPLHSRYTGLWQEWLKQQQNDGV